MHSTYVEVLLCRLYLLLCRSDRSKMELPLSFTSRYNAYKLKHIVKKAGKNRVQLDHCMMWDKLSDMLLRQVATACTSNARVNTNGKVQKDIKCFKIRFLNPIKTMSVTHRSTCMNTFYQLQQLCIINRPHVIQAFLRSAWHRPNILTWLQREK
jgi:hypothetical protein